MDDKLKLVAHQLTVTFFCGKSIKVFIMLISKMQNNIINFVLCFPSLYSFNGSQILPQKIGYFMRLPYIYPNNIYI